MRELTTERLQEITRALPSHRKVSFWDWIGGVVGRVDERELAHALNLYFNGEAQ